MTGMLQLNVKNIMLLVNNTTQTFKEILTEILANKHDNVVNDIDIHNLKV